MKMTLERMARSVIAAQEEYRSTQTHFVNLHRKLTRWETKCREKSREEYRRALIQGIEILSRELTATTQIDENVHILPEPKPEPEQKSDIETDIAQGTNFDV